MKNFNPARIFILVLLFFIYAGSANLVSAAPPIPYSYDYTHVYSSSNGAGGGIVSDSDGNIYTSGYFYGTHDFDFGSGTDEKTPGGTYSAFLTKTDSSGNYVWTKVFQGSGNSLGFQLSADSLGNIYWVGSFTDTVDFDPSSGTENKTSRGIRDFYIVKLNSSGDFIWVKTLGTTSDDIWPISDIDAEGNIYLTNYFGNDTLSLDGTTDTLSSSNVVGYIVKYDADGNYDWSKNFGETGSYSFEGVTVDRNSGYFYLAGYFSNTFDFDFGSGTTEKTPVGGFDSFLAKYDLDGDLVWVKTFGGSSSEYARGVTASSDDVYIFGSFTSIDADFDPSEAEDIYASEGSTDLFVSKYSNEGVYQWTRTVGGTSQDEASWGVTNHKGDVYIGGSFIETVDLDPGHSVINAYGADFPNSNALILALDESGNTRWVNHMASDSVTQINSMYYSDIANKLYLDGVAFDDTDFNTLGGGDLQTVGSTLRFLTRYTDYRDAPAITLDDLPVAAESMVITGSADGNLYAVTDIEYQIDGYSGTWSDCTADDGAFDEVTETFSCSINLTTGSHTIYFRSKNTIFTTTPTIDLTYVSFTLENDGPGSFKISNIKKYDRNTKYSYQDKNGKSKKNIATYDKKVTNKKDVTVVWDEPDDLGAGLDKYTVHLKRVGKDKTFIRMGSTDDTYYTFTNLKDGKYEWYVTAKDINDNESETDTYTFKVDTKSPDELIIKGINNKDVVNNKISIGQAMNLLVEGTGSANDTLYMEIYSADKSTKYETHKCKIKSDQSFNCNFPADINTSYKLVFYIRDQAENKSDDNEIFLN